MREEEKGGIEGLLAEKKRLREECRKRRESAYKHVTYPFSKKYDPHPECLECNGKMDSDVDCDIKNLLRQVNEDIKIIKMSGYEESPE